MQKQATELRQSRKEIILANPRGFCAGVDRAILIVKQALAKFGSPIYVRHEVVHNTFVVNELKMLGAIFIENLNEVPAGAILIFSAHGVSQAVREEAKRRNFTLFDATCPLVTKVHLEAKKLYTTGYTIIMIGHKGHPEVEGTMGQVPSNSIYLVETKEDIANLVFPLTDKIAYITQTTLSVDDTQHIIHTLQQRFPQIVGPSKKDICYATQNRQDAVKQLSQQVDLTIVVGSHNSSNTTRLWEVASQIGKVAYQVDSAQELKKEWFIDAQRIGVTAGASAPEILVKAVVAQIEHYINSESSNVVLIKEKSGVVENTVFNLPKGIN